jgi:putative transposon-encoded protein
MDIHGYPLMRIVNIKDKELTIKDKVETLYEKTVTPFGNSAKVDAPKKFIGRRAFVIIMDDD